MVNPFCVCVSWPRLRIIGMHAAVEACGKFIQSHEASALRDDAVLQQGVQVMVDAFTAEWGQTNFGDADVTAAVARRLKMEAISGIRVRSSAVHTRASADMFEQWAGAHDERNTVDMPIGDVKCLSCCLLIRTLLLETLRDARRYVEGVLLCVYTSSYAERVPVLACRCECACVHVHLLLWAVFKAFIVSCRCALVSSMGSPVYGHDSSAELPRAGRSVVCV